MMPADETELDELEDTDQEEGVVEVPEAEADPSAGPVAPDLEPEIEEEIKKVLVMDEELVDDGAAPKAKNHQIPQQLIDKELEVEDLFDQGSI